jgi:hypothetical protein
LREGRVPAGRASGGDWGHSRCERFRGAAHLRARMRVARLIDGRSAVLCPGHDTCCCALVRAPMSGATLTAANSTMKRSHCAAALVATTIAALAACGSAPPPNGELGAAGGVAAGESDATAAEPVAGRDGEVGVSVQALAGWPALKTRDHGRLVEAGGDWGQAPRQPRRKSTSHRGPPRPSSSWSDLPMKLETVRCTVAWRGDGDATPRPRPRPRQGAAALGRPILPLLAPRPCSYRNPGDAAPHRHHAAA